MGAIFFVSAKLRVTDLIPDVLSCGEVILLLWSALSCGV